MHPSFITPNVRMVDKKFHNPGVRVTVIGDGPRYLVATRSWSVQLEEIQGETGRFHAFSETRKHCAHCNAKFNRKLAVECPGCRVALEPLAYLVDCTANSGRTKCACESYTCNRRDDETLDTIGCCKHGAAALVLLGYFTAVAIAQKEQALQNRSGG